MDSHLYVVRRNYFWDKEKQRGVESREYVGKVVNNCFYTMEEFKRHFKRNGEPRAFPKQGAIKRRTKLDKATQLNSKDVSASNRSKDSLAVNNSYAKTQLALDIAHNKDSNQPTN